MLVITYFEAPQIATEIAPEIAPDHTIFVKKIQGDPPSNSVTTKCYGATNAPAMLLSFLGI